MKGVTVDTLEIDLWLDREILCSLCGQETPLAFGIPTYNGDIVSNDFPDALRTEGGGSMPVCQQCYLEHKQGLMPTFDHYYVPVRPDVVIGGDR